MTKTRRGFIKDAACTGAVVSAGSVAGISISEASEYSSQVDIPRCPYFDQPLTCGGPDSNGNYACDA